MVRVLPAAAVGALGLTCAAVAAVSDNQNPSLPAAKQPGAAQVVRRIQAAADLEQQVVFAINDVRRAHALRPVRLNRALTAAAREHSESMAEHGYFRHDSWGGSPFWKRLKPVYPPLPGRTWATGENLVWSSPELTATGFVDIWLHRASHRRNLLNPEWRDLGVGGVRAADAPGVYQGFDVTILTADFGSR
jgi:uncharacterized protein YkwD